MWAHQRRRLVGFGGLLLMQLAGLCFRDVVIAGGGILVSIARAAWHLFLWIPLPSFCSESYLGLVDQSALLPITNPSFSPPPLPTMPLLLLLQLWTFSNSGVSNLQVSVASIGMSDSRVKWRQRVAGGASCTNDSVTLVICFWKGVLQTASWETRHGYMYLKPFHCTVVLAVFFSTSSTPLFPGIHPIIEVNVPDELRSAMFRDPTFFQSLFLIFWPVMSMWSLYIAQFCKRTLQQTRPQ